MDLNVPRKSFCERIAFVLYEFINNIFIKWFMKGVNQIDFIQSSKIDANMQFHRIMFLRLNNLLHLQQSPKILKNFGTLLYFELVSSSLGFIFLILAYGFWSAFSKFECYISTGFSSFKCLRISILNWAPFSRFAKSFKIFLYREVFLSTVLPLRVFFSS